MSSKNYHIEVYRDGNLFPVEVQNFDSDGSSVNSLQRNKELSEINGLGEHVGTRRTTVVRQTYANGFIDVIISDK